MIGKEGATTFFLCPTFFPCSSSSSVFPESDICEAIVLLNARALAIEFIGVRVATTIENRQSRQREFFERGFTIDSFLLRFGYIFSHSIHFACRFSRLFFPWRARHDTKRSWKKKSSNSSSRRRRRRWEKKTTTQKTVHIFQFSSSHVEMVHIQWVAFVFSITRSIFSPAATSIYCIPIHINRIAHSSGRHRARLHTILFAIT